MYYITAPDCMQQNSTRILRESMKRKMDGTKEKVRHKSAWPMAIFWGLCLGEDSAKMAMADCCGQKNIPQEMRTQKNLLRV